MKKMFLAVTALALCFTISLTGCSGSVTLPDTNITIGFKMSQSDIEKIIASLGSASDQEATDDERPSTGVDITDPISYGMSDITVKSDKTKTVVGFELYMPKGLSSTEYDELTSYFIEKALRQEGLDVDKLQTVSTRRSSKGGYEVIIVNLGLTK